MKQPLSQIFLLFLTISASIILIECLIADDVSSFDKITSNRECSQLPGHIEDPHLVHFDDVPYIYSSFQSQKFTNCIELACCLSVDLNSNYLSFIWQPPKQS